MQDTLDGDNGILVCANCVISAMLVTFV
jgi:hypothetical protein